MNEFDVTLRKTVGVKILELLDRDGPMNFSGLKKGLDKINDGDLGRGLKNLAEAEPPYIRKITKNNKPLYEINYDHPELSHILIAHKISAKNVKVYPVMGFTRANSGKMFCGVSVITQPIKSLREDLEVYFSLDDLPDQISHLFLELLKVVLIRKLENAIKEGEIKKEDVFTINENGKSFNFESPYVRETWNKMNQTELSILISNTHLRIWDQPDTSRNCASIKEKANEKLKLWEEYTKLFTGE